MPTSVTTKVKTKEKTTKAIIQTLLLTSVLVLTFNIHAVKADSSIYIRPDGAIDPPTVPIQRIGDIYTLISNIREPIVVQRNNTILNGNGFSLQGNGTGQAISLYNVENVTIKNTEITGFSQGIHVSDSPRCQILKNTAENCTYGIIIDGSPETTMENNIIKNNKWDGIFITASPHSSLTNNTVTNQGKWGIYLGYSPEATLKNNKMKNNNYNLGLSDEYTHNIDATNTVNNKPVYYWINRQSGQVPADAGFVAVINSINIEIANLDLEKNGPGMIIVDSAHILVENSIVASNGYYGIYLIRSNHITLRNNTISNNDWGGIAIISSSSSTIINNTIKSNDVGINLQNSNGNQIHHNNFINNTSQAVNNDSINDWDDGSSNGGNYWSDYKGKDADGDGVGDTPYNIDNDNQDHYPLMHVVQNFSSNHIQINPIFLAGCIVALVSVAMLTYITIRHKIRARAPQLSSPKQILRAP